MIATGMTNILYVFQQIVMFGKEKKSKLIHRNAIKSMSRIFSNLPYEGALLSTAASSSHRAFPH